MEPTHINPRWSHVANANANNDYLAHDESAMLFQLSINNTIFLFLLLPVYSRLALGVEDRRIPDGGFSASSSWDRNHGPKRARLNIIRHGRLTGAWSSRANNRAQWLLIDITKIARVVGFAIQGRQDYNQWVMSLRISYSRGGIRFRYYTERRRPKVCWYPNLFMFECKSGWCYLTRVVSSVGEAKLSSGMYWNFYNDWLAAFFYNK